MAKKLPFYQLYVDDFDDDPNVMAMGLAEVGLYQLALNRGWKMGSIPDSADELARMIRRKPTEVRRAWARVRECFVPGAEPGRLVNPRQEKERAKALDKSHKATTSINRRYSKATNVPTNTPTTTDGVRSDFVALRTSATTTDVSDSGKGGSGGKVGHSAEDLELIRKTLEAYMEPLGFGSPDGRIVLETLRAGNGASALEINQFLVEKFEMQPPGKTGGPKSFAWFPTVVRGRFANGS
jgi:uncharacterized protein YdaU (DUF1376 family)